MRPLCSCVTVTAQRKESEFLSSGRKRRGKNQPGIDQNKVVEAMVVSSG